MTKSDLERMETEEPEQYSLQYSFAEEMSWGRVLTGGLALIVSVAGAAYWAGGKSVKIEGVPRDSIQTVQAATPGRSVQSGANPPNHRHSETVTLAAMPQHGESRVSVSFLAPVEGATVAPTMLVRGIANGVQAGKHLWLVTHRAKDGGIWPKERIQLKPDGTFEQQIWDFGADGLMSVCLLATNSADTTRFENWLAVGDRDDEWPALHPDPSRSTMLGCQEVTLLKKAENTSTL